jgi:hypothetical protein
MFGRLHRQTSARPSGVNNASGTSNLLHSLDRWNGSRRDRADRDAAGNLDNGRPGV